MATQGMPLPQSSYQENRRDCASEYPAEHKMEQRFSQMTVASEKPFSASSGISHGSHFQLTDSMPSFELDANEVARVSPCDFSALPCTSCSPKTLSSTDGPCQSCLARSLSSKVSDGSIVPAEHSIRSGQGRSGLILDALHPAGKGFTSQQKTKLLGEVQYKSEAKSEMPGGAHVSSISGHLPLNSRDEREVQEARRQDSGSTGRGINRAQDRSTIPQEYDSNFLVAEEKLMQLKTSRESQDSAIGGQEYRSNPTCNNSSRTDQYNTPPAVAQRRQTSPSGSDDSGQETLSASGQTGQQVLSRSGRIDHQVTKQSGLRLEDRENEARTIKSIGGKGDRISLEGDEGFLPLTSKDRDPNLLCSDDGLGQSDSDEEEFYDVLVIYHKKDVSYRMRFESLCHRHGWTTITKDEFPIGTRHFTQLEAALENCTLAVALITSSFLGDEMAAHEHQTALNKSIEKKAENFIPVLYEEGLVLPSYLAALTCGRGWKESFERQLKKTMKRAQKKQRASARQLNHSHSPHRRNQQPRQPPPGSHAAAAPNPPSSDSGVPAMFRSMQAQLSPGPHAQRFFSDGRFRELCLVLDLSDPLGAPYWCQLAEHIGFTAQDIEWLDSHGRCAANVLEVFCCKHSEEGDIASVLAELQDVLETQLHYMQAGGIVAQEIECIQR